MQNITLQFVHGKPLYWQLYAALAEDIRSGRLAAGEALPSKRRVSEQLRIGLNTVDAAYQMLVAEGYLAAKPRSGYTVCRLEALALSASFPTATQPANPMRERVEPATAQRYSFETAGVDTALFPFKTWRRLGRDLLAGDPSLLNHGHRQGDENLRRAIATHLHEFRGARCEAHQIVVGAGIEYLLGLLARLFAGEVFAVEHPGYARTHRVLENNGARVAFVPLDADGMCVTALEQSKARLAYVTPSHQFPTGVTMPVGRRTQLLRWAAQGAERYLIEDDYDSEFRFDGKPIPALQGLDDGARVIYISTFSKSIAPAIRIGYMVLPHALLARYHAEFGFYSCTVSRFEQQTLCRFMEGGHFARHLARLRIAYRQRRDALVAALTVAFGQRVHISGSHTGLHLLLTVENAMTQAQLVSAASAHGVRVTGLAAYGVAHGECAPAENTAAVAPAEISIMAENAHRAVPAADAQQAGCATATYGVAHGKCAACTASARAVGCLTHTAVPYDATSIVHTPTVVLGYAALPPAEIADAVAALRLAWGAQEVPRHLP